MEEHFVKKDSFSHARTCCWLPALHLKAVAWEDLSTTLEESVELGK